MVTAAERIEHLPLPILCFSELIASIVAGNQELNISWRRWSIAAKVAIGFELRNSLFGNEL
jgi:hypothetical protein